MRGETELGRKRELATDLLHAAVLWNFAFVQPLFDLLSQHAEFFVARGFQALDIFLFVLVLCLVPPVCIAISELIASLLGSAAQRGLHGTVMSGLAALIVLPLLARVEDVPGMLLLGGAFALGVAFVLLLFRFHAVRMFLTALSPALLVFPGLFLVYSPVSKIVFPQGSAGEVAVQIRSPAPIVFVVFDEFALESLLDERGHIDADRYPHFAAFARKATWFRNATTVADFTTVALPALVTGNYPRRVRLPTAIDNPRSLFTLLEQSYDFKIVESRTQLCPDRLCGDGEKRPPTGQRLVALFSDLCIVSLHIFLPADLRTGLPSVTQDWMHFAPRRTHQADGLRETDADQAALAQWLRRIVSLKPLNTSQSRAQQFERFLETIQFSPTPTFYFLHTLLPHIPYIYLPSGKIYSEDSGLDGLIKISWNDDTRAIFQTYQRYLLQVRFVDTLIGRLMERLRTVGLYDSALIIVTADHGVSFRPGDMRRTVTPTNYSDVAAIPLFIKVPHQVTGAVNDRNVEIIDLLPTVAEVVQASLPWQVNGQSVFDHFLPERKEKIIFSGETAQERFVFHPPFTFPSSALKSDSPVRQDSSSAGALPLASLPLPLVGKLVSAIPISETHEVSVDLEGGDAFSHVDPHSVFVPAYIRGRVVLEKRKSFPLTLAVAVNGIIRAVTQTFAENTGVALFSTVVPEEVFQAGHNEVEIFIVSHTNEPRLIRLQGPSVTGYFLASKRGSTGEIISSSNGETIPIVPGAVQGFLDAATLKGKLIEFVGWAADVYQPQRIKAVWIFADGRRVYAGRTDRERPDVVRAYGAPILGRSGFRYNLPAMYFHDLNNLELRVFAVSQDGTASELYYPNQYRWGKRS